MNDAYMEVLEQYGEEMPQVRRGRGAWICVWPDGVRQLKEYRGSLLRLTFEETVLKQLKEQGIGMVDLPVRNLSGELLTTAGNGVKYVLKEWYPERECFLGDSREILLAVAGIARLHHALRSVAWKEEWTLDSMLPPDPAAEMRRHNRELRHIRNQLKNRRNKNEFELCAAQSFAVFYGQAVRAQEELEKLERDREPCELFLCHGDMDQHHVLLKGCEAGFIEFNQMHRGNQMEDLYHFMRKVMEKHNWNERLGLAMLEQYDRIQKLSVRDRSHLYYLFLYPEKYWKQLNFYVNAGRSWLTARSAEKLHRLEAQHEQKLSFLGKIR